MVIVLIGVLPAVLLVWGRAAMLALGDAAVATRILSISIAAQFALLLLLVRPFGATGAAVGFAAMYAILAGLTLVYLRARELV
jgi:O-antigen/teichoic acid export membrane protein